MFSYACIIIEKNPATIFFGFTRCFVNKFCVGRHHMNRNYKNSSSANRNKKEISSKAHIIIIILNEVFIYVCFWIKKTAQKRLPTTRQEAAKKILRIQNLTKIIRWFLSSSIFYFYKSS